MIGINLRGVWSSIKYELRQMQSQGSGAIVNNASVGALVGNPGIGSYIASKHGVIGASHGSDTGESCCSCVRLKQLPDHLLAQREFSSPER